MQVTDIENSQAICVECRQTFPSVDMIHIGETSVCATCKPLFLQKLAEGVVVAGPQPIYFPVSITKLIVLSFATLNFYLLYWFYKNWSLEKKRTKEHVSPFWRTVFMPVFVYSLFHRMYVFGGNFTGDVLGLFPAAGSRKVIPFRYTPGTLAAWFVAFSLIGNVYNLWFIGLLNAVPIILVQQSVEQINKVHAPYAPLNRRFSIANVVVVVLGSVLWMLALMPAP